MFLAAQHLQRGALLFVVVQHVAPKGVELALIVRIDRREPGPRRPQPIEAIVAPAPDGDDLHPRLQHLDEGREQLAIDAVFVEIVRRPVRGRDQRHAPREHRLEQPAQDHGVGDVGDLQLVEAQQARLIGDHIGHRRDRIVASGLTEPRVSGQGVALAPEIDEPVHLAHEGVEVDAPLGFYRSDLEEQVHQRRLAAPHRTPKVGAAHALGLSEQAPGLGLGQGRLDTRQGVNRRGLRGVGRQRSRGDPLAIGGAEKAGHPRPLA